MQPAVRSTRRKAVLSLVATLFVLAVIVAIIATPGWLLRQRIRDARQAIRDRNYEGALEILEKASKLGPHHPDVQLLIARAQRHLNNLDEAAVHLGLAEDNGKPQQYVELEWRLIQAQTGQLGEVAAYVGNMLVAAEKDQVEVYEAFVRGFLAQCRFNDAGRMLDSWSQMTSGDPLVYMYRGQFAAGQHQWTEAIEAYRMSVKFDDQNVAAFYGLGRALLETGNFSEAGEAFRRCLELAPDHLPAHAGLADCLLQQNSTSEARKVLEAATANTKFNDQIQLGFARLAFLEQNYEEALRQLEPILEKWPEDEKACALQAQVLENVGKTDEAAQARDKAQKAAELLATFPSLLKVALEHPSAATHYEIGRMQMEHGSREEARQWIEASLLIFPTNREARQTLIDYLDQIGEKGTADTHRRLLEVRPQ